MKPNFSSLKPVYFRFVGTLALIVSMLVILCPVQSLAQLRKRYATARAELAESWYLVVYADGAARLTYGGSDSIDAPAKTFSYDAWVIDFKESIEAARRSAVGSKDHQQFIELVERAQFFIAICDPETIPCRPQLAVFTPEIKAYCDKILALPMTERMRTITNRYPVFSERHIEVLSKWSSSALRVKKLPENDAMRKVDRPNSGAGGADAREPSRPLRNLLPSSAKVEELRQSESPVPVAIEMRNNSPNLRGWLVVVLLAIAAFLTYRFIRLRLGS